MGQRTFASAKAEAARERVRRGAQTVQLNRFTTEQFVARERELGTQYDRCHNAGLKLDLTRGKPSTTQVALADAMDGILLGDYCLEDGTDVRNYGLLDGIPEAKALGAALLGIRPSEVMVGGNSSLTLMYHYVFSAWLHGVQGPDTAWRKERGPVKFLCIVPGYDRHFTVCESLGIEMITVAMTDDGPDMDQVEGLVREDPFIKGIWCVPKHSNPTGHVYSPVVVDRMAKLGRVAGANFRIMWDNAYAVHDLYDDPPALANIMELARQYGTEDSIIHIGSTSKITHAGAGLGFLGATAANLEHFRRHLSVLTIGPDKINQLRHVRFLKDLDGIRAHMKQHAAIVRPKFEIVQKRLAEALDGTGMGRWTTPKGGYFVSFEALPGLATQIVRLAGNTGVKLTPAGATFPYKNDPNNSNIRIAPTYPSERDLDQAMEVFVLCVQLASVRQRLQELGV